MTQRVFWYMLALGATSQRAKGVTAMPNFRFAVLAAFVLGLFFAVSPMCSAPAFAQDDQSADPGDFYDQLSPYGQWIDSERFGEVWQPTDVSDDFRPYYDGGHWVYTEQYGWYWDADSAWGDIVFHYGRWVNNPDEGWLWVPGYVWGPGWVVWRSGGDYVGWMPMPPDERFLDGEEDFSSNDNVASNDWDDWDSDNYGYTNWYGPSAGRGAALWVFVGANYLNQPNYRRFATPRSHWRSVFYSTRNYTHYTRRNDFVVNFNIGSRDWQRRHHGHFKAVNVKKVNRRNARITRIDARTQLRREQRRRAPRAQTQDHNKAGRDNNQWQTRNRDNTRDNNRTRQQDRNRGNLSGGSRDATGMPSALTNPRNSEDRNVRPGALQPRQPVRSVPSSGDIYDRKALENLRIRTQENAAAKAGAAIRDNAMHPGPAARFPQPGLGSRAEPVVKPVPPTRARPAIPARNAAPPALNNAGQMKKSEDEDKATRKGRRPN